MRAALLLSLLSTLLFAPEARAQTAESGRTPPAADSDGDAPRGFYDLAMPLRFHPEGESTTFGLAIGAIYRPIADRCMHLAAELGFDRGERRFTDEDLDTLGVRGALGAVFGRATRDGLWLGAGPMVDLGYARASAGMSESDGFSATVALRASARLELVEAIFTYVDLRIGYTIPEQLVTLADGSSYGLGGPLVAIAIGASLGP